MSRLLALNDDMNIIKALYSLLLLITWLAGFVLAKGFWSTLACFIPFYAWYLVIEKLMIVAGLV